MELPIATVALAGDTVTEAAVPGAGGVGLAGAATVMAALALFPSQVAVIVAEPAARPVTAPNPFTVATVGALLLHVTSRPLSTLPAASVVVALSCTLA